MASLCFSPRPPGSHWEIGDDFGDGRDGEIRTHDHLNPIQVRYQTAPRPDRSESTASRLTILSSGSRRAQKPEKLPRLNQRLLKTETQLFYLLGDITVKLLRFFVLAAGAFSW